jgi:uncharacterized membrane protein YhfC
VALGDTLAASPTLQWGWLALLSASAGVCEEVGRWIGYRWLFRPEQRTWRQGVLYGLGHGGLESMVLIGGLSALSLAGLVALNGTDVVAQLPPEQRQAARAQLAALAVQPAWFPLLGAWERLSALALHVGLSLIVLRAFNQRSPIWLAVAVVVHTTVNFVAVALLRLLGTTDPAVAGVAVELAIVLMAGAVIWASLRMSPGRSRV